MFKKIFGCWLLVISSTLCFAEDNIIPRKIISFYDQTNLKVEVDSEKFSQQYVPDLVEMPLNYLGLSVEYYSVHDELPDLSDPNILGVVTWFTTSAAVPDAQKYISWLLKALQLGKKVVIFGEPGFTVDHKNQSEVPEKDVNKVFRYLGMEYSNKWVNSYHSKILYEDKSMISYEKILSGKLYPFLVTKIFNHQYKSYLTVSVDGSKRNTSDLVVTGPHGGYVASNYEFFSVYSEENGRDLKQWIINPFLFLSEALDVSDTPKPDVTTLDGLRMYFSHIDGDGWNNVSEIESFPKGTLSAEVVYQDVLKAYPQMPVTVSAITADIDKEWVGTETSIEVAKKIFSLDNVQLATHTYSHPFQWEFFKHYDYKKEIPYLKKYSFGSWQDASRKTTDKYLDFFTSHDDEHGHNHKHHDPYALDNEDYETPRGFANKKFNLQNEIIGSSELINQLSPKNKQTDVVLWSGNCSPFEEAIKMSRNNGMLNMNGGDTRFDEEYDSVAWVAPIGKMVGEERQIYAVNSNENTYTELWSARFFGFKFLTQTFKNTEEPLRLKPMNLYYHMYSAEKEAALNALIYDIEYIQNQPHIAITALDYIKTANGFYTTELYQEKDNCWSVKNRGKLNTIRFDHADLKQVDFAKSQGVIGQNFYRGTLYVALEPTYSEPLICLNEKTNLVDIFETTDPYLLKSTWQISNFNFQDDELSFYANGWGTGKFTFVVPEPGIYTISTNDERIISVIADGNFLSFEIANDSFKELNFSIIKQSK